MVYLTYLAVSSHKVFCSNLKKNLHYDTYFYIMLMYNSTYVVKCFMQYLAKYDDYIPRKYIK